MQNGWTKHQSADLEPEAVREQADKGHCSLHTTLEEVVQELQGCEPVLSKIALITKQRSDGTLKRRFIWDLLRSSVNEAVALDERIVLPRLQDLVEDILALQRLVRRRGHSDDGSPVGVEQLVIDIADAFHNIPTTRAERRFCCAKVGGMYIVFRALCMGGRASPNVWGRFAAGCGRILAAVADPKGCRCEIYVDDPAFSAVGSKAQRDEHFICALLILGILRMPLAWSKAACGRMVQWIGATVACRNNGVSVTIPEDKVADLLTECRAMLGKAAMGVRQLRAFAGRLGFFAGIIPELRPFLPPMWAAISSRHAVKHNVVGIRRIRHAIAWTIRLLEGTCGDLCREFGLVPKHRERGHYFSTDACPWGMAGVLFEQHKPVEYWHCPVSDDDLRRFRAKRGSSDHNTLWEALAILISARMWLPRRGCAGHVRSDSLVALRAMVRMCSTSPSINAISRELALDSTEGCYTVDLATHIPGISNTLPDELSRAWDPSPKPFPRELLNVKRRAALKRDSSFWRTWTSGGRGSTRCHGQRRG